MHVCVRVVSAELLSFSTLQCQPKLSGAGGNRTPVPQVLTTRDTTVPDYVANAAAPAGGLITEVIRGSTF